VDSSTFFLIAADAVLLLHVFIVAFIVVGLLFVFIGKVRLWSWIRNPWFRITHLVAIAVVIVQSWFGVLCPLTIFHITLARKDFVL